MRCKLGNYVDGGQNLIRYQALDCPVGAGCANASSAGAGGFTYDDFGKVYAGGPEVHADGEIWGETLWDLRQALGSTTAEELVTRALELSPPEPSFLDMRNAILQADATFHSGSFDATIWSVFAARGMGFFASTTESSDVAPVADTHAPPTPGQGTGTVKGTVNSVTGPVAGATVSFGGHNSGFAGDLVTTTGGDGSYALTNVPVGSYPQIIVNPIRGHDRLVTGPVSVTAGATTTQNLTMVRDWAASGGGASVVDFTGGNFTNQGCGPPSAIDQSAATVWSANITSPQAYITVALPQAVDVTGFAINPTAGCGDDPQSSLGQYKIEVSSTSPASGFTTIASGTMNSANLNRSNAIAVPGSFTSNVRYVRLTALAPMDPNSGSGLSYVDATEFEVFGAPAGTLVPTATAGDATGIGTTTVTLNGLVNAAGLSTNYHFDYGKTTGYGTATVAGSAGAAIGDQAITSSVANLAPDTIYHYRLSATNGAGTGTSVDRTFRTAAVPDTRKPKAKISLAKSQKIHAITVTVTSDEAGSVLGTATASSTSLRPRAAKTVTLGRKTARITKPGKVKVTIKLTKSATKRLKRARKRSIRVTVRITVTDKAGNATALRKTITLKR